MMEYAGPQLTMTMFPPLTAIACGTAAATVLVLGLVTAACGGVAAGVAAVVAAVGVAPANWTRFPFKLITEMRNAA
jgi:hypothetical protein